MRPWHVALGGGLLASGGLLTFFLLGKKSDYEARGRALEASVAGGSATSPLARQAQGIKTRLEAVGQAYTTQLAQSAADAHMARYYGITPARMAAIDRLKRTLGV